VCAAGGVPPSRASFLAAKMAPALCGGQLLGHEGKYRSAPLSSLLLVELIQEVFLVSSLVLTFVDRGVERAAKRLFGIRMLAWSR